MLVLEYKIKAKPNQYQAIEDAIHTTQFVRNQCLRYYWMDSPKESRQLHASRLKSAKPPTALAPQVGEPAHGTGSKINGLTLNKYSTELRNEFKKVH